MDLERVEVLRGPQGTLFGKNTIGGVLHVITEKPKMGNSGAVELSAGNYSLFQARGKGNFEVVKDKLAVRFTTAYRQRDGWLLIENNDRAKEANQTQFLGGRVSMLYTPSDKLSLTLRGSMSKDFKAEIPLDYTPRIFGPSAPTIDDNPFNRTAFPNFQDQRYERELTGGSAKLEYKLDDKHTLTFLSGYHHSFVREDQDFDQSEQPWTDFFRDVDYKTQSHELRISTPRKGQKLFYLGGLFYLRERIYSKDLFTFGQSWFQLFKRVAMLPDALEVPDYYADATAIGINEGTSVAGFGTVSYEISERIRLNVGGRYTYEKRNLAFHQVLNGYEPFNFVRLVAKDIGSEESPELRESKEGFFSGNIGMDFKTSDNTLIYASVARGYKGAGFNVTVNPVERGGDLVFNPESINSYEIGLKLQLDNRMRINTAGFATVYKDKQEYVVAGQSSRVVNAEAAEGIGIESEWTAIWNDLFRTEMSMGAQNLTYFDFPFVDLVGNDVNLSGNSLFKSPNFTFRFTPQLTLPIDAWQLNLRTDYAYTSKSYNDIYNTESLARQPSHLLNG
ncbi:MAG: TonB-dependent receptor, partial [Bacteroidota bacterium]